jgi:hypothetical protein
LRAAAFFGAVFLLALAVFAVVLVLTAAFFAGAFFAVPL